MKDDINAKHKEGLKRLHDLEHLCYEGDYETYIDELNQIYQEFKEMGGEQNILNERGFAFYCSDKYDEAIQDLTKAIELGGNAKDLFTLQCLHVLGMSYFMLSQWEDSLNVWKKIEEISQLYTESDWLKGEFEYLMYMGETLHRVGRNDSAVTALRNAYNGLVEWGIEIEEEEVFRLYYHFGKALVEIKRYEEALSVLEKIDVSRLIEDERPNYLKLKCLILYRLELNQKLLDTTKQIKSLGIESLKGVAMFYSGTAYHRLGVMEESEKRLQAALRAPDTTGWIHKRAKQGLERIAKKKE